LKSIFENYIECKPCSGGGFTGNTGDLETDACWYCNGLGMVLPEDAAKICDYCDEAVEELKGTPIIADVSDQMCKQCWDITRETYLGSTGEDVGEFK